MAGRQDTIWKRFLSPVVRLLIDEDGLRRYADSIDWEKECDRFRRDEYTEVSEARIYGLLIYLMVKRLAA